MRDVNAPDLDSVAFSVRGGFAGLNLDVTSQDSSWTLQLLTGKWILFQKCRVAIQALQFRRVA